MSLFNTRLNFTSLPRNCYICKNVYYFVYINFLSVIYFCPCNFNFSFYCLRVFYSTVYIAVWGAHTTQHLWKSEDSLRRHFLHMGPGDQTQA